VLKTDLEGVSRTRSFKIYQAVGGSVVPYRTRRTNRVDDQPAPQKAVEFQKRTQVESPGIRRTPVEVFDWSQIPDHNNFRRVVNFDMPNVQHAPRLPRVAEPTRRWYEVLEVKPIASIEQIRSAYRAKIGQYHPDRVTGLGAEFREIAERRSKEINVAYGEAQKARV